MYVGTEHVILKIHLALHRDQFGKTRKRHTRIIPLKGKLSSLHLQARLQRDRRRR